MSRRHMLFIPAFALVATLGVISGCADGGTGEKAGKAVDNAVEKAGDGVGTALNKAGDAVKDVTK